MTRHFASIVFAFGLAQFGFAQASHDCSVPSTLRVTMKEGAVFYQLDSNKAHKLFALGEVASAVSQCKPDKMLFVIADPTVPVGKVILPGKEQITNVRYFIQYGTRDAQEIIFGSKYPRLPLTADVKAYPPDNGTLHPPTKIPTTKGSQ